VQIGKRNAENAKEDKEHYDKMYETIQNRILQHQGGNISKHRNQYDKEYIRALIGTLENLSYKNEEKTRVLWDNFNKEFNKK
jgi:hypothetical protein